MVLEYKVKLFKISKNSLNLTYFNLFGLEEIQNKDKKNNKRKSKGSFNNTNSSLSSTSLLSNSSNYNEVFDSITMSQVDKLRSANYFYQLIILVSIICLGKLGSELYIKKHISESESLELNNKAIKLIFCFQKLLDSNYNGDGDVSTVKILSYIKTKLNLKTPTSSLKYKNNTKEAKNSSNINVDSPFVSVASTAEIAGSSSLSTPNSFKRNSNGIQIGNGYSMDNNTPQTSLFRSDSTSTSNSIIGGTTDVKTLFPSNGSKSVPLTNTRNKNDSTSTLNAGHSVNETNSSILMNNANDKNISSALMGHSNSNLFDDLSSY
ncbi:unnamed protein product [[Candida] boidinii]|uniref:Unnamed protein product n=1 Tax=Candida boidinii TaxID=5477 RepID=A0ACB5U2M1_CANBO|nr:unnamed protein product [[Candida] boidinii]